MDIAKLFDKFIGKINSLIIPFLVMTAGFLFVFGVFKLFTFSSDEKGREEAKKMIMWGLVGLFVMTSVWGLVNVLTNTFDFGTGANMQIDINDIPGVK